MECAAITILSILHKGTNRRWPPICTKIGPDLTIRIVDRFILNRICQYSKYGSNFHFLIIWIGSCHFDPLG